MSVFDEGRFPPLPKHAEDYWRKVQEGRQRMRESRAVICGLARNLGEKLVKTIWCAEALGSMFADYRVVVYENDSTDTTRLALEGWAAQNPCVTVLGERRGDPVNPIARCLKRAARMAYYRNEVRRHIAEHYAEEFPYVVVADLDLKGGWSLDGVANTFGHQKWDFMGANGLWIKGGRPVHYDAWAWRWSGSYQPVRNVDINFRVKARGEPIEPVASCFGGLGVYRSQAMQRASYDGADCEHVPFHRKMRENGLGRIFFNPSQIVLY